MTSGTVVGYDRDSHSVARVPANLESRAKVLQAPISNVFAAIADYLGV
jgi:hypothetical protein